MKFFDARKALNKCNDNCPLKQKHKAHFVYFEYHGKLKDVNVVFCGESPGEFEVKYKQPFYPKAYSGRILRQIIKDLDLQNYGIANIVCCRPIAVLTLQEEEWKFREKNRTPSEEECNYCIDHLKVFLKYINPKSTVILLGKTASFSIFKNIKQIVKDNRTITSLTKLSPLKFKGRIFAAAYHPRFVMAGGGIKGKRYQEYFKRMKFILNK